MCDICNSLFGHLSDCPERSASTDTLCGACENQLEAGEAIVCFPRGVVFCEDCVKDFDMYDLCLYLEVDNAFELIQKFDVCKIEKLGRWE